MFNDFINKAKRQAVVVRLAKEVKKSTIEIKHNFIMKKLKQNNLR